jgi:hypothetical protein
MHQKIKLIIIQFKRMKYFLVLKTNYNLCTGINEEEKTRVFLV